MYLVASTHQGQGRMVFTGRGQGSEASDNVLATADSSEVSEGVRKDHYFFTENKGLWYGR